MAILYSRVQRYRIENGKRQLTNEELCALGKVVIAAYSAQKDPKKPINFDYSPDEGGIKVIAYPRKFHPQIDEIIANYYKSIEPKIRKRIPLKSTTPIYQSTKIS